jgi:hypothetical protein
MVKVFSFCLYGIKDKYNKGMLKNIELINKEFPDFEIWVYIGEDITILNELQQNKSVKCIFTGVLGNENMSYRFFAIDNPDVEIAIVRDADSRVYSRDVRFIKEFINSDKLFHIIRDHPHHTAKIMGGMWAMKKGIDINIQQLYMNEWRPYNNVSYFFNDSLFLRDVLYDKLNPRDCMFHINYDINEKHFVGQVYLFDGDNEYTMYNYDA